MSKLGKAKAPDVPDQDSDEGGTVESHGPSTLEGGTIDDPSSHEDGGLLPVGYVPTSADVVCGIIKSGVDDRGSQRYRKIILKNIGPYLASQSKDEKSHVVLSIIMQVQNGNPRGEFIKRAEPKLLKKHGEQVGGPDGSAKNGSVIRWRRLKHTEARDKCSHALRKAAQQFETKHPDIAAQMRKGHTAAISNVASNLSIPSKSSDDSDSSLSGKRNATKPPPAKRRRVAAKGTRPETSSISDTSAAIGQPGRRSGLPTSASGCTSRHPPMDPDRTSASAFTRQAPFRHSEQSLPFHTSSFHFLGDVTSSRLQSATNSNSSANPGTANATSDRTTNMASTAERNRIHLGSTTSTRESPQPHTNSTSSSGTNLDAHHQASRSLISERAHQLQERIRQERLLLEQNSNELLLLEASLRGRLGDSRQASLYNQSFRSSDLFSHGDFRPINSGLGPSAGMGLDTFAVGPASSIEDLILIQQLQLGRTPQPYVGTGDSSSLHAQILQAGQIGPSQLSLLQQSQSQQQAVNRNDISSTAQALLLRDLQSREQNQSGSSMMTPLSLGQQSQAQSYGSMASSFDLSRYFPPAMNYLQFGGRSAQSISASVQRPSNQVLPGVSNAVASSGPGMLNASQDDDGDQTSSGGEEEKS